ncbi:cation diffusion facilitator family transporter [Mariprofundus erugo]|uniref:Cation diffusion facilitator family transporter n=1 Tax=Mariprofundus erugo TaxID=2528639 RepID=A0A5R9GT50_9PROT|nr:cation diffusion facilitator family transporter [Mariprofundus erugo]TLS66444.1 cation diffusion facilitator family transporter [Mariprofundus erugo]TLS77910.1 cation diffusion facilitator family transporter [Mariprofundus erugo]
MSHGSTKAVLTALGGNVLVTAAKFFGFFVSGSSALLAEAVHSLADTANQGLLYLGLRRSVRKADEEHHFGYGQERYFWNLVSAVTIFFLGCVYTVMHAVHEMSMDSQPELSWIPFMIIGVAFLAEGYSFQVAMSEFRLQAAEAEKSLRTYFTETRDPTTLAVLIEDSVAVLGLFVALIGMGLSAWTGSALFDGIAAICIGLLMGGLAVFLASMNRKYLLNRSDDEVNAIALDAWGRDSRVQEVQRINSIVLSPDDTLLMAEVELREEAIFADMSDAEVAQAIRFMHKLGVIRRSLEDEVSRAAPEARHIFIEFATPQDKPDKA